MKRLWMPCILILSSCFGGDGPPPMIIEKASAPEPLWVALSRMGEDAVDPVLARGEGLEIRRSQLLASVLNQHGREALVDLARCEAGIRRMRKENIRVSSESVEVRARELLTEKGTSMTDYLSSRAIDKAVWVNEITLALGFEELCRHEMCVRGAALVAARTFPTEKEALSENSLEGAESSWVADFLIADVSIRHAVFGEGKAPPCIRVPDGYLAFKVLKRSSDAADLADFKPTPRALALYLDLLVAELKVDYLWDRAYHELDKIRPQGVLTLDASSPLNKENP